MKRRIATPRSGLGTHFAGPGTEYTPSDPEYDPGVDRQTTVRFTHDAIMNDKDRKAWYKLNGPIKTYKIGAEVMDFEEYQALASRTAPKGDAFEDQLGNYAMGASGEAGELVDAVKKHLYQGHDLDDQYIVKEIGDAMWYLANLATLIGQDLETVADINIKKLKKRYPNGFSEEDSVNRVENQ